MASSIVSSAGKQLGSFLVEEFKRLHKVSDQIEDLQTELAWMECFLRDADTRQHQEKVICMLLSQVRDIAYQAEDLLETYINGVSHHRKAGIRNTLKWFSCILWSGDAYTLHTLGSDIDNLTDKISKVTSKLQAFGIQIIRPAEYDSVIREERRTYSHFEEDEIVGLKKDVNQLVDKLVKEDVKVASISGIGGLGKSTLARKVFLHESVKNHFNRTRVWVYISQQVDRDNVFREILKGLTKDKDDKIKDVPIVELPKMICELLEQRRCFVVLDDLWDLNAWDTLKPAFATIQTSSSNMLITTRNQGLLQNVENGYFHCLEPLSDQESWELFQLKAFPKIRISENKEATSQDTYYYGETSATAAESSPPRKNLKGQNERQDEDEHMKTKKEKLGKEMLKHCEGLPLAIIALGGILLNKKTYSEWEHVQKNISSYLMASNSTGVRSGVLVRVLELSYHDLPFYLKPCFLYLGNFPEDYKIKTSKLYQLWEAEGFLAISANDEEVEGVSPFDIGERYLHELIERSMVQVGRRCPSGRIKSCRVHDLMRDLCLKKCREVSFLNVQQLEDSVKISKGSSMVTKKVRRYAFHLKDEISDDSKLVLQLGEEAQYTRSLLLFAPLKVISDANKMLKNIRNSCPMLRILNLDQYGLGYTSKGPVHLREVGRLIHLRYLSLRNVPVKGLTSSSLSLWDLKYLISLDLRTEYMGKVHVLPNRFHQMERLRHLYLPLYYDILDGEKLNFKARQMVTLKNLHLDKCEIGELLQMTCLRIFTVGSMYGYVFDNCEVLKLLIKSPVIQFGMFAKSGRLKVKSRVMEEDPEILTPLHSNPRFTYFEMVGSTEQTNIHNAIAKGIQVFPSSLTKIWLEGCKLSKEIISALEQHPKLEQLWLDNVQTDRKISFSAGGFKHLQTLYFFDLPSLEEWEAEVGTLSNLTDFHIYRCPNLKMISECLPDIIRTKCAAKCNLLPSKLGDPREMEIPDDEGNSEASSDAKNKGEEKVVELCSTSK